MSNKYLPSRPRVIGSNAGKYVKPPKPVTVIGEVNQITPEANSFTLRMPDDENIIVLISKNHPPNSPIERNLLTEVSGTLMSRGQMEATWIKQYDAKQTSIFNKSLYLEAAQIYDAYRTYYDF